MYDFKYADGGKYQCNNFVKQLNYLKIEMIKFFKSSKWNRFWTVMLIVSSVGFSLYKIDVFSFCLTRKIFFYSVIHGYSLRDCKKSIGGYNWYYFSQRHVVDDRCPRIFYNFGPENMYSRSRSPLMGFYSICLSA